MRVLTIDDDPAMLDHLRLILTCEGHKVAGADTGEEGISLARHLDYDIITLDLNLPDMSGLEVLKTLRVSKIDTPILILSGLGGIEDKVRGLGFGADDYMTKPFHGDELLARLNAVLRRAHGHAKPAIVCGALAVDTVTKTVSVNGTRIHFTGKEYALLEALALRKGITRTRYQLMDQIYGGRDEPDAKLIDVYIHKLRKKIGAACGGDHYIETVYAQGWRLVENAQAHPCYRPKTFVADTAAKIKAAAQ